jgi:hypothetical protein
MVQKALSKEKMKKVKPVIKKSKSKNKIKK